jgi:hypothetical protein
VLLFAAFVTLMQVTDMILCLQDAKFERVSVLITGWFPDIDFGE